MRISSAISLTKAQKFVIYAVSFGNILEWYEIYLYVFWAPTLAELFFNDGSTAVNLFNTISLFALGFLIRPLGGIFFGRLGDKIGRKKAFILSILTMTIPTFLMGVLPVYQQIGILAPIFLGVLRILQTFPSGGELPGAFCYLYENSDVKNRKFMTSFGAAGNQIGIALSATECFLLEVFLPEEIFIQWGWRISFMVGGCIGLGGLYLRRKLHETRLFQEMVVHHRGVVQKSLWNVIRNNLHKIIKGISFGFINAVSFYLLSILFPIYFTRILGTTKSENELISIFLLILTTIPLPLFGVLGDRFNVKKLMIGSTVGILILLYPLYIVVDTPSLLFTAIIGCLFILCMTCITALIPFLLANLFPTSVRYTCLSLSFNIVDGIVGGLSPVIAFFLLEYTGQPGSICWILLIASLISLFAFFRIKENEYQNAT